MLKVENVDVYGFEAAIRGMRNPMNSWEKSDSDWCIGGDRFIDCTISTYGKCPRKSDCFVYDVYCIGENDMELMQKLYKGGTEHRKFMRMINVTMDIVAPDYWFKEFSTYRIGVTENSTSTMHKIHAKEFTLDDFSHEHLVDYVKDGELCRSWIDTFSEVIEELNFARTEYLETKDKKYWWQMIQLLPMSYNYRRTVQMNYEVCANILRQRRNHKLDEWYVLCDEIMKLPYMKEIIGGD